MEYRKAAIILVLSFLAIALFNCNRNSQYLPLTGSYLGQSPPQNKAKIFARGIVSTQLYERDFTISPKGDEIYYTVVLGENSYSAIAVTRYIDDKWTKPQIAGFSKNPAYKDLEPHISPDGRKFYFVSNRPAKENKDGKENWDIWIMDKTSEGWSEPYNPGQPLNSKAREFFPSVTKDGTIYFTREGQNVNNGIYRSRFVNGNFTTATRLPEQVNTGKARYNAFIAPDEKYIIIPVFGRKDSYGGTDYYISFRNSMDRWTEPLNMGSQINSAAGAEWSASVSPDGKYIFFMTNREENSSNFAEKPLTMKRIKKRHCTPYNGRPNIYWMQSKIIDSLRIKAYKMSKKK